MKRWRSVLLICGGILVIGVMWLAGSGWGASGAAVQFVLREEIRGPYWTVDEGFQARLMLSNTTDEPIRVYPEVYAATGEGVVLPWLALREHERREVDLGAWLSEQGGGVHLGQCAVAAHGRVLCAGRAGHHCQHGEELVVRSAGGAAGAVSSVAGAGGGVVGAG